MREFRKSWNDLVYILKETPNSQEILSEIKSLLEKWRLELGNEKFANIEIELNKELEEAKSYVKTNQPIPNKNEEIKSCLDQKNFEINTEFNINDQKNVDNKNFQNQDQQSNKKGFKKIKIFEEEIPEEHSTKDLEPSNIKKDNELDVEIDDDLSNKYIN